MQVSKTLAAAMNTHSASQNPYSDESFRRMSKTAYWLSLACLSLAFAALAIDVSLARFALAGHLPGDLYRAVNFAEVFAHGLGVATICFVIFVLDPTNRRALYRIAICAFGAGLLANVIKFMVARQRPYAFLSQADSLAGGVWDTFLGFFARLTQQLPDPGSHTVQSFPSGHTATAVAFAFALAWRYPRGRWLFATFAVMAGLQRIMVGAHYLSDTLVGASAAALLVAVSFDRRLIRLSSRLMKPETRSSDNGSSLLEDAA